MQLTVNINFSELLNYIRHLPANQIAKLKSELDEKEIINKAKSEKNKFQKLLLEAPVMNDDQFEQFIENRKKFNKWRKK